MLSPPRTVVRTEAGIYALERALRRRGFARVAGADEAGRGACAGPLVAAAVVLPRGAGARSRAGRLQAAHRRRAGTGVRTGGGAGGGVRGGGVPPGEVDRRGLHVCNVVALRRALAALSVRPDYVLTDGFPVDGLGVPGLAVWKGDQVAACVAAAGVVAKVTRDRLMVELHERYPGVRVRRAQRLRHRRAQCGAGSSRTVPGAPLLLRERSFGAAARASK